MKLFPADAEVRLGFDLLRAHLEGLVRGPLGLEAVQAMAPSSEPGEIRRELTRTAEMQGLLAFDDPFPLGGASDLRPLLQRLGPQGAFVEAIDLHEVLQVIRQVRRVHAYLQQRRTKYAGLWQVAHVLAPQPDLEKHLERILDEQGRVRDDASAELVRISRTLLARRDQVRAAMQRALRDAIAQGYATEDQPTMRGGRAVIPIRAEAKRKVAGFVHDVSATGQTVYIEPAAALDANNEIRELEVAHRQEVERILREASGHVRSRRADIAVSLTVLGALDGYSARARLSNQLGALVPDLNTDGLFRLVNARNPILLLLRQPARRNARAEADEAAPDDVPNERSNPGPSRAVVPLHLELGGAARTLVITGPNAGGKSVAMKTVGLLALMAACGLPVPADPGTTLPVLDRLFVDLGDQQSVEDDLSTFTSHLYNLRQMLAEADARSLVLIDEAGTGTDPAEGGALAQAILERLTDQGARTIATTHYGSLKAFAHTTPGVLNGSMAFDRETLTPTYRFVSGIPGSSYAFDIAARVGLDADVLARARDLAGVEQVSLEALLAEVEAQRQTIHTEVTAAAAARAAAEQARRQLEDRLQTLRMERDRYRSEALAEAEQIVRTANAQVEQAVREIREAEAEKEVTRLARERLEQLRTSVQGQQEQVRRRQKTQRKPRTQAAPPSPVAATPLREGDQVRLDDGDVIGEIIDLTDKEALIALGALKTRVARSRLTKVGGARPQRVDVRMPGPSTGGPLPITQVRTRIDVRGYRVEEALQEVDRLVDEGQAAGLGSVEVLHGKGTGALRLAIQDLLRHRDDIAGYHEAAWNQGGAGVTIIELAA